MSDELSTAACAFALLCAGAYAKLYVIKDAQHNSSLRGRDYYKEVMTTQNEARFFEVCKMSYASFLKFVNLLVDHGGLEGSRNIHTGEITMMFMNSLTGTSDCLETYGHCCFTFRHFNPTQITSCSYISICDKELYNVRPNIGSILVSPAAVG